MSNPGFASRRGTRDHNCDSARTYTAPDGTVTAAVIDGAGNSVELAGVVDAMSTVAVRIGYRHGGLPGLITAGSLLVDDEYDGAAVLAGLRPGEPAVIAWIGDCRAYRWNGAELRQWTTDHTMGQQLRASGGVPVEFAKTHDHWLRTGLRGATAATVRQVWIPDYGEQLGDGDLVVLTSDGVHDQVEHEVMTALVREHATMPTTLAAALVASAAEKDGYRDDATAVVLRAGDTRG